MYAADASVVPRFAATRSLGLGIPTFTADDLNAWDAKMQQWRATLSGLNEALVIAQQNNDESMKAQVRSGINFILADLNGVKAQAQAQDAPADVLVRMQAVGDQATALLSNAGGAVMGVADAASSALAWIANHGVLLLVGLGVITVVPIVAPGLLSYAGARRAHG